MFGLGAGELLLIFVIAILFLGPKKLPELAKGLGQAMKEFQKARDDMMNEIQKPAVTQETAKSDIEVAAVNKEDNASTLNSSTDDQKSAEEIKVTKQS